MWQSFSAISQKSSRFRVEKKTSTVAIKWWLLLRWVTFCGQLNHLGIQPTTKINSAFHPFGAGKSITGHACLARVEAQRVDLCQVAGNTTLCGSIWQVNLRSFEMGFP